MKKFLTFEQVRSMWRVGPDRARVHLWAHGITTKRTSQSPSIPAEKVLGIDPPPRVGRTEQNAYEPTQAQIRKACLEIQSRWTDEVRAQRYVGPDLAVALLAYQWDGFGFQEKLA